MPELPEVRVSAMRLNEAVSNRKIKDIKIYLPKLIKELEADDFRNKLIGKTIKSVSNHGKFLVFNLDNGDAMLSHLRMTGQYYYYPEAPLFLEQHRHVIWYFEDGSQLQYQDPRAFGSFHYRDKDDIYNINPLAKMAQEPQNTGVNDLYKQTSKSTRAIKTFLLDQSKLVGLGNIYVNEVLWFEKIHPATEARFITKKQLKKILETSARIMDESTKLGGTTIDSYASLNGQEGNFQNFLKVHGKEKKPCARCGKLLSKSTVNGRGTYFCAKEQKIKK